jgi:hypothetical protein
LIALPYKTKAPVQKDWQKTRLGFGDLRRLFPRGEAKNVGILLGAASGGVIDCDLDCEEAFRAWPFIMPDTPWIFGRASRPQSHLLYRSDVLEKPLRFRDVDGAVLVELRGDNHQTIAPPSTHPSGEAITWVDGFEGDPAHVELAELQRAVGELAAASLLARHWPHRGGRQDAAMALAGGLLRAGWSQERVENLVEAAAVAARDEEFEKRKGAVARTAGAIEKGGHVTGWPSLATLLGKEVVDRAQQWLGINDAAPAVPDNKVGTLLTEVQPEQVSWLWSARVPFRKLAIIDGDPGLGKSTLALALAAAVTRGRPLPGDDRHSAPAGAVLMSAEDGLSDTIRPRLDAAEADLARIVALDKVPASDGPGFRLPVLPLDVGYIRQAARRVSAKLVIIDPLAAYLGHETNTHRDQDIRRALFPLAELAQETGAAVIVVRHLNKATGSSPLYRGGGSIGIIGAARSGLLVARDPDNPDKRVLASTKCNLAKLPPSIAFELSTAENGALRVLWGADSSHTAETLLAVPRDEGDRDAVQEAVEALKSILKDGAMPAADVMKEARRAGISDRTIDRAKALAGIRTSREGFGSAGRWVWTLRPAEMPTMKRQAAIERQPLGAGALWTGDPAVEAENSEIPNVSAIERQSPIERQDHRAPSQLALYEDPETPPADEMRETLI